MEESYKTLKAEAHQRASALNKKSFQYSLLRFFVFLSVAGCGYLIYQGESYLVIALLLLVPVFILLIIKHRRIKQEWRLSQEIEEINDEELRFLGGDQSHFSTGSAYQDDKHPFASDLDLFGSDSLFQHLSRCSTDEGQRELALMLKNPSHDQEKIVETQRAVRELASSVEWRQRLQAFGRVQPKLNEAMALVKAWGEEILPPLKKWQVVLSFLVPALFATASISSFFWPADFLEYSLWILLAANLSLTNLHVKKAKRILSKSLEIGRSISQCVLMLEHIENQKFESKKLQELQASLKKFPSTEFRKLSKILFKLESIYNDLAILFLSGFYQYHVHALRSLIKWRQNHATSISEWFKIIGQTEALDSLANFAYNNPSYAFPSFNKNGHFDFSELGHPFLEVNERITNDLTVGNGELIILTGSNMSGKSTFLRTVGINLVLSRIGSCICAEKADVDSIDIFVQMKVSDSLVGGQSYFFAEVDRLRYIKESLEKNNGLVLLDEILRGTNSGDKQAGTIEFLKKIQTLGASGIVATHDLGVCKLADDFPESISTKCFEVEIKGDQLLFDYKLREGVCTSKNATFILKQNGIID